MNLRTIMSARPRPFSAVPGTARPPVTARRPALYLAVAAAGALMVNVITAGEPAAHADAQPTSVSIAAQLGVPAAESGASPANAVRPLEELTASRSERDADRTAAAQAQAAADAAAQAAAAEAARVAAEQAAAAAAQAQAQAAAAAAPSGSFQDYARSKLGGDSGQFSCLESLWGKESGWNPNAQNPGSTAYGIPQFLNSTWATTGIPKTSDGYKQIDAGLIYIDKAYGSPCGAWSHSRSTGWY